MSEGQKWIKIGAIALAVFIILIIINAILFLFGIIGGFGRGTKDFSEYYSNINSIEIDVNASSVNIVKGDSFLVEAKGVSDNFRVNSRRNTLEIEEDAFWFFNNNSGEITIYVPSDLNELVIDGGSGEIKIEDIIADRLELDLGAGLIEIASSTFYKADIDGGVGVLNANNTTFTNLSLDSGVGEVNISGNIYGNSEIDGGIGEINLNLTNESLYRFIVDKGLGDISVNGTSISGTYGNGENVIDIDNGIGAVNITFD